AGNRIDPQRGASRTGWCARAGTAAWRCANGRYRVMPGAMYLMQHMKVHVALVMALLLPLTSQAQNNDAAALVDFAAQALGGADTILAVEKLELRGYGTEAYFWGGGNINGDPEAMQKWAENPDFASVWDFAQQRWR